MDRTSQISFSTVRTILEGFSDTLTRIHAQFTILANDLAELMSYLQMHFPGLGRIPLEANYNRPPPTLQSSPIALSNVVYRREATDRAFRLRDEVDEAFEVVNNRMQYEVRLPWIEILGEFEARGSDEVMVELTVIDKEIDDLEKLGENLRELIKEIPLTRPKS